MKTTTNRKIQKQMKTKIILLILLLAISYKSQTKLDSIKMEVQQMQFNLSKCHKQYNTGTAFIITGSASSAFGAFVSNSIDPTVRNTGGGFIIAGGLMLLTGLIIQINSHNYIGKAGLSLSSNGVIYRFKH